MNRENILNKIQLIFRDILDNESMILTEDLSADAVDNWDSLAHINIISAIEKDFKIRFALGELDDLKSVNNLLIIIESKLGIEKLY